MTDLLTVFKAKRNEIGTKALSESLEIKDSAVRMICTGHYPNPDKILKKFAQFYIDVVICPYVQREIKRIECTDRHTSPRPFGGAAKTAWWDACQHCEHK